MGGCSCVTCVRVCRYAHPDSLKQKRGAGVEIRSRRRDVRDVIGEKNRMPIDNEGMRRKVKCGEEICTPIMELVVFL